MRVFKIITFIFFALQLSLVAQIDYELIRVKTSFSGAWSNRQAKVVPLIKGYTPVNDGSDDFTKYGTYKHLRTDSTGFFYVKKIDGRWWMVDPEGYAGVNMAVTSFGSANIQHDYDLTRNLGFNASGNFLSSESQTKSGYNAQNYWNFGFTRRLNFFLSYKSVRRNYYTTPDAVHNSHSHITVFDPMFEEYCDNHAKVNVSPFADERDLLGWFTDNEINFNQDQLRNLVRDLLPGDPSRDSALVFAATKGLTETDVINYTSNVTEAIKQEFASLLAERYFRIVSQAIRRYDTNHLMLGSRFHGRPRGIQAVVEASHKYMDVSSVNFYDRFSPNESIAKDTWTNDKPSLVGEFYIKDITQSTSSQSGAGWYVDSQGNRGKFYQNTVLELLENKSFIGWHYFRFADDDDGSNKGIVSRSGSEYVEMTKYMKELNEQVYQIIDHFDGITRRPELPAKVNEVFVNEDAHVIPGTSNQVNFGAQTEMEVQHNLFEFNRREVFLKFDLQPFMEQLKTLKNAILELHVLASDNSQRALFASGINEHDWYESTFSGALRQVETDWRNGFNRIAFNKGVISPGLLSFDVTPWIADQPENTIVSLKIHDLIATNSPIKIASKEHVDGVLHPRLKLTFWDDDNTALNEVRDIDSKRWSFFPNPTNDYLYIPESDVELIELFTLNGKRILSTSNKVVSIAHLDPAVYVVKMSNAIGEVEFSKLVVSK